MNVLETILHFLTTLARIIFPRKRKPAAGDCLCPNPLPAPESPALSADPELRLPVDAGTGSDDHLHRGDTLALVQGGWGNVSLSQPVNVIGCCLMLTGAAGCVYKWFVV